MTFCFFSRLYTTRRYFTEKSNTLSPKNRFRKQFSNMFCTYTMICTVAYIYRQTVLSPTLLFCGSLCFIF